MTRAIATALLLTVASTVRSQSLADLWDGRAKWAIAAEKVGADFTFHCLSILPWNRKLLGYYIANYTTPDGRHKMGIGRACSDDGVRWTDEGRLLSVGAAGAWDDRAASFPGIWKDGDTWYLVYEGAADDIGFSPGDIGLATSTDGKNFTKHPSNPILRHEKAGWERVNIGTPSLYKVGDTWYLYYHGFDGSVCQIGVASGKNLTSLSKSSANPIIPVSADASAWDAGATGKRSSIVKEGDFYYLAFEGRTPLPDATARWSSGLARSHKLTSEWSKCPLNPLIPTTPGYFGYDAPELLQHRDAWLLYVRSPGANATHIFKLAPNLRPPARP
jgi:predicted GH43/DUF377 family glycosyl hydrolase